MASPSSHENAGTSPRRYFLDEAMQASPASVACPSSATMNSESNLMLPPMAPNTAPNMDTPEKNPVSRPSPGTKNTTVEPENMLRTMNSPTTLPDFFVHNASNMLSDASVKPMQKKTSAPR